MIDKILGIGGAILSGAWAVTTAHYMFDPGIYKQLRSGGGLEHPGFGNIGKVGVGSVMASGLDTELGRLIPDRIRQPMKKFLKGGKVFEDTLAFGTDAEINTLRYGRRTWVKGKMEFSSDPASLGKQTWRNRHLTMVGADPEAAADMLFKRRMVRGLATTGQLMTSAALIAGVVMPLAFDVSSGIMRGAQGIGHAVGSISRGNLDWGTRAASNVMLSHAATERQRSIQVMEQARMSGRSFMGQEAQVMHR
jgi:hypothetical protein